MTSPLPVSPARPTRRRAVERAVVGVVLLVVVGFVLRAHPVDAGLARALNSLHVGVLGAVGSAVYTVFEPVPAVLLTMVLTGLVWARTRRLVTAAAFAGVVALTWIPSDLLKVVVGRPRPDGSVLPHPFVPVQPDASFPSGHTVFVVALVLAGLMLVPAGPRRRVLAVLGGVVVLVVATALAVDGVHWPTDVVASVVWALAVAPVARIVWVDLVLTRVVQRGAARVERFRTPDERAAVVGEQTGRHRADEEDAS
ncbi:phosphatase PAP2 family protein [Curtobacterium sp. C1]|uniref:phosphatase PAP2 family protein n=1 Tax=Curtobacterium TaxID=2034 RepID=UPI001E4CE406|nr:MULTISPECIES: phosphatase PAP2 family protein [Curtobacterium]UFU13570.1 phosphatase PAP2 family protein [Curtobacterium sp. C1]WIJ44795.1 phosphatase PAP2 family protein [Curtobacterium citreum]